MPITTRRPDVPAPLAALVMRCIAKDPDDRPPAAPAILASLESRRRRRPSPRRATSRARSPSTASPSPSSPAPRAWPSPASGSPSGCSPPRSSSWPSACRRHCCSRPKRALRGGLAAVGGLIVVTAGYMALRVLGIGPAGSLFAQGVLKERDAVVMTDFRAVKADSSLAAMLGESVRAALTESNALSLVSPEDVKEALVHMRRDPSQPLDLRAARDVALRNGAKAVVDGDISGVAGGYLVSLRLISADLGTELAAFHAAADGPKQLIETADLLARQLRAKAGESLRHVNGSPELWNVTTDFDRRAALLHRGPAGPGAGQQRKGHRAPARGGPSGHVFRHRMGQRWPTSPPTTVKTRWPTPRASEPMR